MAFYVNSPAMRRSECLTNCQSQPRTARLVRAHVLSAVKAIEYVRQFVFRNSQPGIADLDFCQAVGSSSDIDPHLAARGCIAQGVADQIEQYLLQSNRIAFDKSRRGHSGVELYFALLGQW